MIYKRRQKECSDEIEAESNQTNVIAITLMKRKKAQDHGLRIAAGAPSQ
jgi:hypothetical protein